MEKRFLPLPVAGEQIHVVHRQQLKLLHGFQHVRHQRQQFGGGQQAGVAALLLGPAHRPFEQMAAALAGGAPHEHLTLVAVAGGGHRGPGGAVRPGVEVLQSVAFTQLKGEGQLTGHGRLAETERG